RIMVSHGPLRLSVMPSDPCATTTSPPFGVPVASNISAWIVFPLLVKLVVVLMMSVLSAPRGFGGAPVLSTLAGAAAKVRKERREILNRPRKKARNHEGPGLAVRAVRIGSTYISDPSGSMYSIVSAVDDSNIDFFNSGGSGGVIL